MQTADITPANNRDRSERTNEPARVGKYQPVYPNSNANEERNTKREKQVFGEQNHPSVGAKMAEAEPIALRNMLKAIRSSCLSDDFIAFLNVWCEYTGSI